MDGKKDELSAEERVARIRMLGVIDAFNGEIRAGTTRKLAPPDERLTIKQVGLIRAYIRRKFSDEAAFIAQANKALDTDYEEVPDVLKIHMNTLMSILEIPKDYKRNWVKP